MWGSQKVRWTCTQATFGDLFNMAMSIFIFKNIWLILFKKNNFLLYSKLLAEFLHFGYDPLCWLRTVYEPTIVLDLSLGLRYLIYHDLLECSRYNGVVDQSRKNVLLQVINLIYRVCEDVSFQLFSSCTCKAECDQQAFESKHRTSLLGHVAVWFCCCLPPQPRLNKYKVMTWRST